MRNDGTLPWIYDDGGAGPGPEIYDCVARAIAIATGRPYDEVSLMVDELLQVGLRNRGGTAGQDLCDGVPNELTVLLMSELGWRWVPLDDATLADLSDESRFIAQMYGHVCAVINGVVRDKFDCTAWSVDGIYLPPADDDDRWHRLEMAAETGALQALIRQSVSYLDDECHCDYCEIGDWWNCPNSDHDKDADFNPYFDLKDDDDDGMTSPIPAETRAPQRSSGTTTDRRTTCNTSDLSRTCTSSSRPSKNVGSTPDC